MCDEIISELRAEKQRPGLTIQWGMHIYWANRFGSIEARNSIVAPARDREPDDPAQKGIPPKAEVILRADAWSPGLNPRGCHQKVERY